MRTQVKKWGNSLAVRIPRSFAAEAGLTPDAPVEMRLVDGSLVVTSVARPDARLAEMLARVDEANRHGEVDDGPAVGGEAW
jgi:antitoxin MazE